jgi:hypothetical protein
LSAASAAVCWVLKREALLEELALKNPWLFSVV